MLKDYIQTVRLLFRDAQGLEIEEVSCDLLAAYEEMRRAYEEGVSEQEASERLQRLVAECS